MKKLILSLLSAIGLIGSAGAQNQLIGNVTNRFYYTGNQQIFTVPQGVTNISFELVGASGGDADGGGWFVRGGAGGKIKGNLSVTPGKNIYIYVGGYGLDATQLSVTGGFNGGGNGQHYSGGAGGGATDLRIGGIELPNRVAVAGGGGGANSVGGFGGVGGNNGLTMNILGQGGAGIYGGGGGGYYGGYYAGPPAGIVSNGQGGSNWADTNLASNITNTGGGASLNKEHGYAIIAYTQPKTKQTITFLPLASKNYWYGMNPISLSATNNSGLPIVYSVVSGPGTISGNLLSVYGAGTITVQASQAGNGVYASAQTNQSIVINKGNNRIYPSINLSAFGSSGLPVSFSLNSGPATVSNNILTINGTGTIVLQANQPGNQNYKAATPIKASLVITNLPSQ
jgi:hypothetical protein